MIDSDEVDVLAVAYDQIVLVECKDTSFGQNDLYITSTKAENVGARTVVVVSTRDVHSNVTQAAERTARNRDDRLYTRAARPRVLHIISEHSADSIRSKILSVLEEMATRHLGDWLLADRYELYGW
jgi:hypothetical protein